MLAHEAYHYLRLKKEGDVHELGLKLDMNKAYDRVEWDFLEATLVRFGFDRRWINFIMSCVTTVSFSIVLNGNPGNFFYLSRGLRQAKQAWRLIENPESMWARVLKARYFLKVGFSEAKKGYRASWGWSSLLEARDFVTKMGCWHVINGSSMNLWKDQWLPPPNIGCLQTIAPIPDDVPTLVSDLMDRENRSWNLDTILHLLNPIDANRILSIPIGSGIGLDRLIWPLSENGKCTVSSGYHWVHSHLTTGSSSSTSNTSHVLSAKCWKMLWGLKTLPKIKCFLWKCLNGAVASFPNLFRMKLSQSPVCPLCGAFDESIEHILLLCHWIDPIWYGSPLCLRIDKRKVTTLDKWLQDSIMKHSTKSDRVWCGTLISFIRWSIWKARLSVPIPDFILKLVVNCTESTSKENLLKIRLNLP
ncbi:hypothetical protein ACLB2K_059778 [Fragaria x ananassa]